MTEDLAITPLFDVDGRRIPPAAIGQAVNPASDRYRLSQPRMDHAVIHRRISEHLGHGPSLNDFVLRVTHLMDALRSSETTRPLTSAPHLPFFVPKGSSTDVGKVLEDTSLPALERSWKAQFPKHDFRNELKGGLAGKLTVAAGSRYELLRRAMAIGPVVGIYFPLALSGFSVEAAVEQMSDLPEGFVLSGGLDVSAALVGCPELMKTEGYAPQLDLSGNGSVAPGYGYHFAPYGNDLTFNGRYHNGLASDYCSSGLTWISQKF